MLLSDYPCTLGELNWLKAKVEKESMRARIEVESGRVSTLPPSAWRLKDAPYQQNDKHLSKTDRELTVVSPGLVETMPLDRKEVSILLALRQSHPVTATVERIEQILEQMSRGATGDGTLSGLVECITARTISDRLKRLMARGLVSRPRGSKCGCGITDAGMAAIKRLP